MEDTYFQIKSLTPNQVMVYQMASKMIEVENDKSTGPRGSLMNFAYSVQERVGPVKKDGKKYVQPNQLTNDMFSSADKDVYLINMSMTGPETCSAQEGVNQLVRSKFNHVSQTNMNVQEMGT